MKPPSDRIAASRFKAECLGLLDRVERTRQPLIVTKRGRPVARVVPVTARTKSLRGRLKITGDIVSPTGEDWNADR